MAISKRDKARKEEALKRWDNHVRLHPPAPPPPWTAAELAEIEKMDSVLDRLIYGQSHDIDLVFEFLSCSYLFEQSSLRIPDLRSKASHYRELQQDAAKAKLWEKIHDVLYGLKTEVHLLRNSRDRRGTSSQ